MASEGSRKAGHEVTIPVVNRIWNPTFLKPEMVVEAKNGDIRRVGGTVYPLQSPRL
jgi:hypothetical protein